MRKALKKLHGQRLRFRATVERLGEKTAFRGPPIPTILLVDVRLLETGELLTDHLWFTRGKFWNGIVTGVTVEFDARIGRYEKGYKGCREDVYDAPITTDYRLERPTRLSITANRKESPMRTT